MIKFRFRGRESWRLILISISILLLFRVLTYFSEFGGYFHLLPRENTVKPPLAPRTQEVALDLYYVEKKFDRLNQTDPQLIEFVIATHLTPPARLPYNFSRWGRGHRREFTNFVNKLFYLKRDGVFLEVGVGDGEMSSHSLYFEERGWTGLLVECNPWLVEKLWSVHRKAWIATTCLSPTQYPRHLKFTYPTNDKSKGSFQPPPEQDLIASNTDWGSMDVDAVPLYTLLSALDMHEVDFFSFDIEGTELSVLLKFPFHLATFKLIIIRVSYYTKNQLRRLNELLETNGYGLVNKFRSHHAYVHVSATHLMKNARNGFL